MKFSRLRSAALLAAPLFAVSAFAAQPDQKAESEDTSRTESPVEGHDVEEDKITAINAPEVKEEKRVCRRIATDMSSRRKERVCLTTEGWRELNQRR